MSKADKLRAKAIARRNKDRQGKDIEARQKEIQPPHRLSASEERERRMKKFALPGSTAATPASRPAEPPRVAGPVVVRAKPYVPPTRRDRGEEWPSISTR